MTKEVYPGTIIRFSNGRDAEVQEVGHPPFEHLFNYRMLGRNAFGMANTLESDYTIVSHKKDAKRYWVMYYTQGNVFSQIEESADDMPTIRSHVLSQLQNAREMDIWISIDTPEKSIAISPHAVETISVTEIKTVELDQKFPVE